jgi:hypothetical protein
MKKEKKKEEEEEEEEEYWLPGLWSGIYVLVSPFLDVLFNLEYPEKKCS